MDGNHWKRRLEASGGVEQSGSPYVGINKYINGGLICILEEKEGRDLVATGNRERIAFVIDIQICVI